jgi:hypothetical protein
MYNPLIGYISSTTGWNISKSVPSILKSVVANTEEEEEGKKRSREP